MSCSGDGESGGLLVRVLSKSPLSKLKLFSLPAPKLEVSELREEGESKRRGGATVGFRHELVSEKCWASSDRGEFICRPLCFALICLVRPAFDRNLPLHSVQINLNAFLRGHGVLRILGGRGIAFR